MPEPFKTSTPESRKTLAFKVKFCEWFWRSNINYPTKHEKYAREEMLIIEEDKLKQLI